MNILDLTNKSEKDIFQVPDFSQLCIVYNNLDIIENKTETLSTLLNKLRVGGELIFSFIDLNQVLLDYNQNIIDKYELCEVFRHIKHYTDYTELCNFVITLSPQIALYKHIKENYRIILSLVRKQY